MEQGIGTRQTLDQGQILDLIGVQAGFLAQIYGKIKNGKTYLATVMAIQTANAGQVVYTNWPIEWNGYDERDHFFPKLLAAFGLKRTFWVYPKENMKFCDLSDLNDVVIEGEHTHKNFYDWFRTLTSCTVFLDEGHIYYDSYMALKMKLEDRLPILETAHYDRSVYIVSQRASAIHAVLRGNVNLFYKVEKTYQGMFGTRFRRIEFQETGSDEKPNEEREMIIHPDTGKREYGDYLWAESIHKYWADKKVYAVYNSKYRRLGARESQKNNASQYRLTPVDVWSTLRLWPKKKRGVTVQNVIENGIDRSLNIPVPPPGYGSVSSM